MRVSVALTDNMADDGLRQLQAELREVYQSVAKQKLSERNVVEIVTKLIELSLIDVIFTTDGKSYVTKKQLEKEIHDELTVHGGRIALVDLQQILNVDFSHVESRVNQMVKNEKSLKVILGQLISGNYRKLLAEDINDMLQEKGQVTIVELASQHDLPAEFIREVVNANIGKKIKGLADPYEKDVVYTESFVSRIKAQIRGALSAVTIPTTVGPIRQSIGCQEHLFHSVLDELVSKGRLSGSLSGSRQDRSQFLPHLYVRAQNQWVENFYKQNGYLEYDAIARLGISDPKDHIRKRFKDENLVFLSSCCVGPTIIGTMESSLDEALDSGLWCDVSSFLPSVLSNKDKQEMVAASLKRKPEVIVCGDSIVASNRMLTESMDLFKPIVLEKAEKSAKGQGSKPQKADFKDDSGHGKDDKREQRRKKAATAGSSKKEGTGGREVKMKSTKKKGGRGRDMADSDEEFDAGASKERPAAEEQFMTLSQIEQVLENESKLKDCPPSLVSVIASRLHRPLQREFQEAAKSIFLKLSGAKQKKMAIEVQDKINGLWTNMRLFEKGLALFEEPAQGHLVKHLLKTIGLDLVWTIVLTLAEESMSSVSVEEEQPTIEGMRKVVGFLPKTSQEPLGKLLSSLNSGSLEEFYGHVTTMCGPLHLGILLKKADKKVDRQLVFSHRQSLAGQLGQESDAAMTLHLAAVLLFQTLNQCMLHVPGRLVPAVLQHIGPQMDADKMVVLSNMQDLVVKHVRYKSDPEVYTEEEVATVEKEMTALIQEVKDIGLNTKKNSAAATPE